MRAAQKGSGAPKKPDPIFALMERYREASAKIDRACEKRDEIEARYPREWFDCVSVEVGMSTRAAADAKNRSLSIHTRRSTRSGKPNDLFNSLGLNCTQSPQWKQKFDARLRDLHHRLDEAEKLQRARREQARHNDIGETYQHYIDEWQSTLMLYHALSVEIARTVPTTLEGHLFKLALFIAHQADGLEVDETEWADIREAMNGLPGIEQWKRLVPTAQKEAA